MDLLIVIIISIAVVPLELFTSGAARIIFGLLLVLFFPGYVLISALFPSQESLGGRERTALSFGLSIAVVPLIGLAINYTPWGVRLYPMVISIIVFIVVMAAIAWFRRQRLPPDKRFTINYTNLRFSRLSGLWSAQNQGNRIFIVILLIAIVITAGTMTYVAVKPKAGDYYTEFYILGNQGNAENYPHETTLGKKVNVILGIVNHEQKTMVYRVEITIDGEKLMSVGPISLSHEQKWEQEVDFSPTHAGDTQKVELFLYQGENLEYSQQLHLWLNVKDAP